MTADAALASAELCVTSFHPGRMGQGGVALGRDGEGTLRRALLGPGVMPRPPAEGECWRFTGTALMHPEFGEQILVSVALPLLPRGRTIVRFLATNPAVRGVGWRTATLLWDSLGEDLYAVLERRDVGRLASLVGPHRAAAIVEGFGLLADDVHVFAWLDRYGVAPRTATAAAAIWGRGAVERIQANPYALSLLETWSSVDTRALRLGVHLEDERRLIAAVEEVSARRWRLGHTVSSRNEFLGHLRAVLGGRDTLAGVAFDAGVLHGALLPLGSGADSWQARAPFAMERVVEEEISARLVSARPSLDTAPWRDACIAVERREGIVLAEAQRAAVRLALTSSLLVLSGGAGTGKTSVVRAILDTLIRAGESGPIAQVALSGRAAKRLSEATQTEAMTIRRFLLQVEAKGFGEGGTLVVDEASMIDLPTAYRLLRAVPRSTRLVLVGDDGQLPPIGPGLVFHRLVDAPGVPRVALERVHRSAASTGIPIVGAAIRRGEHLKLPLFDPANPLAEGVFLAPAAGNGVAATTLVVWRALVGPPPAAGDAAGVIRLHSEDVQLLCATRGGPAGARALSDDVERLWLGGQPPIRNWGLAPGSKVLWLQNDYERPTGEARPDGAPVLGCLMNGTLGVVEGPSARGARVAWDDGQWLEITEHDLQKLTRGWAITVHKAQGSAWRRVVIPVVPGRLLDRTLIYTAVTRARLTAVLVGQEELLQTVVHAPPFAHRRSAGLLERLVR